MSGSTAHTVPQNLHAPKILIHDGFESVDMQILSSVWSEIDIILRGLELPLGLTMK
jgi:hypothetical protein